MPGKKEWFHVFFDSFRPMFGFMSPQATAKQVRNIIRKLGLKPGMKFLDCPCGIGRISIPMAKKGIKVTGVDITRSYLDELEDKARKFKLDIKCDHRDMRYIDYVNEFHGAANIWTSLGYFKNDNDDLKVIKNIYRALKPGGKFLLYIINRDFIVTHLQDSDWSELENFKILEKRTLDLKTSRTENEWTFITGDKVEKFNFSLRHYSLHELIQMFEKAGFTELESYGSMKDEPVTRHSRAIYLIGTKPRRTKRKPVRK